MFQLEQFLPLNFYLENKATQVRCGNLAEADVLRQYLKRPWLKIHTDSIPVNVKTPRKTLIEVFDRVVEKI
ncbi:MAG: hypothetical protein N3E48_03305 [Candidatus Bathyarchaeota archaeon]|nr:hypothetical protein [Candidatus Bathyarchaeota archaeon]